MKTKTKTKISLAAAAVLLAGLLSGCGSSGDGTQFPGYTDEEQCPVGSLCEYDESTPGPTG